MRHPFQTLLPNRFRAVFWPMLVATLLLSAVMSTVGAPLSTPAAPAGIVSFELAGTVSQARPIVESWDQSARLHAAFSLGLDYLYMPLYSSTIALACLWAAGVLAVRGRRLGAAGLGLAWALWLAALLDATENAALAVILFGSPADPWPLIAQVCATGKFALIIFGLLYVGLGALVYLAASLRRTAAPG
jgi:hypothetical protein